MAQRRVRQDDASGDRLDRTARAPFARLDGAPGRTVAWISGPPGSGKTSLAASYVEARSGGCSGTRSTPTMPTSPRSSTISVTRRANS